MSPRLKEAAPNGIDAIFENVGGVGLDAALTRFNAFARIALCGLIAGYDGQDIAIHNVRALLVSRVTLRGFIVSEHLEVWPQALRELARALSAGRIKYRETVAQGLAAAPEAFIGLLAGKNFGKQIVQVGVMEPDGERASRTRSSGDRDSTRGHGRAAARQSAGGPQVLLTKRAAGLAFMASLWVFPGGRMEQSDYRPGVLARIMSRRPGRP